MDEGNYKLHYLSKFQNAPNQIPFHLKITTSTRNGKNTIHNRRWKIKCARFCGMFM